MIAYDPVASRRFTRSWMSIRFDQLWSFGRSRNSSRAACDSRAIGSPSAIDPAVFDTTHWPGKARRTAPTAAARSSVKLLVDSLTGVPANGSLPFELSRNTPSASGYWESIRWW